MNQIWHIDVSTSNEYKISQLDCSPGYVIFIAFYRHAACMIWNVIENDIISIANRFHTIRDHLTNFDVSGENFADEFKNDSNSTCLSFTL